MPALCRDCLAWHDPAPAGRCPACGRPRLLAHLELGQLSLAHLDCDAFYASVEKRDDPGLADRPLIVGGGRRGVVTTCCYLARVFGVRSAMPMFKALKLCPEAVVVRPRMEAYAAVSRQIRALMQELTPLVEPLSLDEAFLDLAGTERLLGAPPALVMARLAARIEREIGVTVSVGLSHNKFLAKLASDMDKPRGFSVIGRVEAAGLLAPMPVSRLWGVGGVGAERLEAAGYRRLADLAAADPADLLARLGRGGPGLGRLARGEDTRRVEPDRVPKSVSAETTFETDLGEAERLDGHLWRLAVKVSDRAKAAGVAGQTVTLKLKTARFRGLTRLTRLAAPSNLADSLHAAAAELLARSLDEGPFRLIGIGIGDLCPAANAVPAPGLFEDAGVRAARAEAATDRIRARFGPESIIRGRALR